MGFWSGTLLAFVAWILFAPGSARAGCSNHLVTTVSFPPGTGIGLDTLDHAGDQALVDMTGIPGRPKPCIGEMCSSRPAVPVSPAPPQVLRIGVWAILEIATEIAPSVRADSRRKEGKVRPTSTSPSIFHPPRLSPSIPTS